MLTGAGYVRTILFCLDEYLPNDTARAAYDAALCAVKRRRNARFKGLVRAVVTFRRLRLRAAEAAYAPGGAGFVAAAASFDAVRSGHGAASS